MAVRKIFTILLVFVLAFALTACGKSQASKTGEANDAKSKTDTKTDASTAATRELDGATSFVIKGVQGEDFEITVEEIKGLPAKDVETQLQDSGGNITNITARGPTLKDVLKNEGINLEEFSAVQVKARDGYAVQIPEEIIKSRDIILAYEFNGKPLPESDTPVRIVIPDEFAMYWVKAVSSLELKKDSAKLAADRMLFLDSVGLEPVEYTFDDEGDKALALREIFDKFAVEYEGKPFLMKARDGLKKTEEMETAKKAYIKITGENAPEFIAPDISYGMYVKNLVWFGTDKEVIMGTRQNLAAYFKSETVPLETVLKEVNMEIKDDKDYMVKAKDGYSADIKGKDLKKGELLLSDDGIRVNFKQLPKKYNIKNLMEISLIN